MLQRLVVDQIPKYPSPEWGFFLWIKYIDAYRQTFNIRGILVGNKIVDLSDVVGASPVGAAPTTSLFST